MTQMTLGAVLEPFLVQGDLVRFLKTLLDNVRVAHPESEVVLEVTPTMMARFGADGMTQVMSNFLSKARNHGLLGEPIEVFMADEAGHTTLSVANVPPPIAEADLSTLFEPFKPRSIDNAAIPVAPD